MKKKRFPRFILAILILALGYAVWVKSYRYNIRKAVAHVETHALTRSHTCCAWFVMRAMQAGGCPIGILPAFAYKDVLPWYGFVEIDKKQPLQAGDIIVHPAVGRHVYGHIAMWTGRQWVSDFKQKSMFPARAYAKTDYKIYRHKK